MAYWQLQSQHFQTRVSAQEWHAIKFRGKSGKAGQVSKILTLRFPLGVNVLSSGSSKLLGSLGVLDRLSTGDVVEPDASALPDVVVL